MVNETQKTPLQFYKSSGFIKKTQKTPDDELTLARKRQKELKS